MIMTYASVRPHPTAYCTVAKAIVATLEKPTLSEIDLAEVSDLAEILLRGMEVAIESQDWKPRRTKKRKAEP